jgi:hypothetical protein
VLWLLIFLLLMAVGFSYLLFAPFYVEINSLTGLYGMRFHQLATVRLSVKDGSLIMDVYIDGWEKRIDLLTQPARKTEKLSAKKRRKSLKISFSLVKDLLCSFKVNQCYLNIDTGNTLLNGMIYPLFYWVGKYFNKPVGINFLGKNEFIVEIENTFASILKTIIYSKLKHKNHGKFR